jgi:DNA ligase (NAD+)
VRLTRAVTRGDGQVGEVITANVRTIRSCRSSSTTRRPVPPLLSVRGEVFLPLQAFDDVNERLIQEGKAPFASPRNVAAGTVRQLDPASRPRARWRCTPTTCSRRARARTATAARHGTATCWRPMTDWGLPVNPENRLAEDADEVVGRVRGLRGERRDACRYEVDGLVVKLDDLAPAAGSAPPPTTRAGRSRSSSRRARR